MIRKTKWIHFQNLVFVKLLLYYNSFHFTFNKHECFTSISCVFVDFACQMTVKTHKFVSVEIKVKDMFYFYACLFLVSRLDLRSTSVYYTLIVTNWYTQVMLPFPTLCYFI